MKVLVLGATGRTGRLVCAELDRRDHEVIAVVRDASRAPHHTEPVVGDVRDGETLRRGLKGVGAVVSTLGPVKGETHLHATVAPALVAAMNAAGVRRFVGVSGAGIDVVGDRKRTRDRLISKAMATFGGAMIRGKTAELKVMEHSDLDWTLVRPPRLIDGPPPGNLDHNAYLSIDSTHMTRADLATFIADTLALGLYLKQAPFAATR